MTEMTRTIPNKAIVSLVEDSPDTIKRNREDIDDGDRKEDATRPSKLGVRDSGTLNIKSIYSSRSSKGVQPFSARSSNKKK